MNSSTGKVEKYTSDKPSWNSVNDAGKGVTEDHCLFWRRYEKTSSDYVDPTGGAQKNVAYWCSAMHLPYNKKTDSCGKL